MIIFYNSRAKRVEPSRAEKPATYQRAHRQNWSGCVSNHVQVGGAKMRGSLRPSRIRVLTGADVKPMAHCTALDIDRAWICRLATAYMSRGSEFARSICQVLRGRMSGVR